MSNRIAPRFHTLKSNVYGGRGREEGREEKKVPQQKSGKAALDASDANGSALDCELIVQRTRLRLGTHGRVTLGRRRDTRAPPRLPRPGRVLSGRRGCRGGSDLGIRFLE